MVGNRTTDAKTGTNQWSYNKNNELQSFDNTSFKYNLNGQMTEKTVNGIKTYYSYNLDGRLSEIRNNSNQVIAQYQYDPFGRRLSKTLPLDGNKSVYFHYSDEGLIAEYDESGQLVQSYGYKPDSWYMIDPIFTYRVDFPHAKGYAYYINDHLGTPQKLIANTGRKIWEASEDVFGKTIITNNEFRNPLRFAGQYFDNESKLRYNYFRYYDPEWGRYITSDPIGLEGGLNTYVYVDGNPINRIDPLGLWWGDGYEDISDHWDQKFKKKQQYRQWLQQQQSWKYNSCVRRAVKQYKSCMNSISPAAAACSAVGTALSTAPSPQTKLAGSCLDVGCTVGSASYSIGCNNQLQNDLKSCLSNQSPSKLNQPGWRNQ